MIDDKKVLAVIPARGGSKGVPKKNIRDVAGKPLLAYTLAQAEDVPELDRVVVSTDSDEIAEIAGNYGGEVLMRPAELAVDTAPTEWALLHALDMLEEQGETYDLIVIMEPTSPFREPTTISSCIQKLGRSDCPSLMTVLETRSNYGRISEAGLFDPLFPGGARRRQDRKPLFVESGTVYVSTVAHLRETNWVVADRWLTHVVTEEEAFDINTMEEYRIADMRMRDRQNVQ